MMIKERKAAHINLCLREDVEVGTTGLENVELIYSAMAESDFKKINTETSFLGKELQLPLLISSMTGGIPEAKLINRDLASAAEEKGIAFAVGSQRAMIEDKEMKETYIVRDVAPNILLFGNIGIVQLKQYSIDQIMNAVEAIDADALFVHINPAQEIFQTEGDWDFTKTLDALKNLCSNVSFPVIAKEVGSGINKETAMKLKRAGVAAIDVAGVGGTSSIVLDALRSGKDVSQFKGIGIPTACSILEVKKAGLPIIGSGGIRTGVDIAKCIALGAEICGIALPFLRIHNKEGKEGVLKYIDKLENELKRTMHLVGCKDISELKKAGYVLTGKVFEWATQRKLI